MRWNTWFRAAIYHADHFDFYQNFITSERINEDDCEALKVLDLLLEKNDKLRDEVRLYASLNRLKFLI